MKTFRILALIVVGSIAGLAAAEPEEEGDRTLPPLVLKSAHKKLLAARGETPKTAADYYFTSTTYVWAAFDFDGKTFIRNDGAAAEPAKE